MTLSSQGVRIFFPRNLSHGRTYLRTYFGTKYSRCPLNTCVHKKSDLRMLSRSFSVQSLTSYQFSLFNKVAESDACALTKDFFVLLHDLTGLPWWVTIAVSAGIMKLYSLPCNVYQQKLLCRLNEINNKMPDISKKAYVEIRAKQQSLLWTPLKAERMYKLKMLSERKKLIEENSCHPLKVILLGYLEIPVWILMSMTWRTMAYGFSDDITSSKILISQMIMEGPFLCVNLTLPDPTYVLPALIVLIYLSVIELSHLQALLLKRKIGRLQKVMRNLSRCFAVLAAVVSSFLPSSVAVFWFFSVTLTLLRDLALISPKVRKALNLPFQNFSYKHIFEAFKDNYLGKVK